MNTKVLKYVSDYVVMTIGVALFSLAWELFMIPNGMSSGGLTGLCTILQFATGGLIDVSTSYLVINVVLLLLGFIFIGNSFGMRTIYCILLSTVLFRVFGSLECLHSLPGHFLYLPEKVLIPILAGLLEGLGLGIIFVKGGSTGGTDIVALFFNKYWPISTAKMFLIMDVCIITAIMFLPGKTLADMIYGYLMMAASITVMNFVLVGQKSTAQLLVFSDKYKEIADYIIHDMDRGVTVVHAQGWFTKQEKDVLLIILSRKEIPEIKKVIKDIDKNAFVSISEANSVYGEGFEEIKTGVDDLKRKKIKKLASKNDGDEK